MADIRELETSSPEFSVAGIGASAGGITALQTLFASVPAARNLAFVVVQHLLSEQPSRLARLFRAWTPMTVREAHDGVVIEPGRVYIAPPGQVLGLDQGAFTTRPLNGMMHHIGVDTIDSFFESLAENFGARAIAVVLSGAGSDGAAGAVCIKQAGGVVLVQDPTTAMHDSMPNAAIANGAADQILPPGALGQELIACASTGYVRSSSAAPLLWRIQHRMQNRRVPRFRDYEALLHDDPTELETLVRGMPIHVTESRSAVGALSHAAGLQAALATVLEAMERLHADSAAANDMHNVEDLLDAALDAIMGLHGADMGNIQLYDPKSAVLWLAAHCGFDRWFLDHFADVEANEVPAFARAIELRERVSIEDVEADCIDDSFRDIARRAGYRAVQSTPLMTAGGRPIGMLSTHFRQPHKVTDAEYRLTDILANELSSALERIGFEHILRDSDRTGGGNHGWLAAQKAAFESAMNGAPLETSLGILTRAAVEQSESDRRCAFYIADPSGSTLRHVVGMSESYAQSVEGFQISPESLACGLAVATGQPVITRDVLDESRWQPWTWLARDHDYRGCWSFPVETSAGKLVGSVAMYFAEPREPTPRDRELAAMLTQTAAIIISRYQEAAAGDDARMAPS